MKNTLSTLALCLITLLSFAQGKCSMNQLAFNPGDKIVRVNDIYSTGIENGEGSALYSVSMTVDVPNKKASNVVLVELKSGKRWLMSKVNAVNSVNIPVKCAAGDVNGFAGYSFKGTGTNMVIYFVPKYGDDMRVVYYLPNGPQDLQAQF
ncbi:MAG TPA: hypothetical protein VGA96_04555 [Fibrella sp.]|jgi:hypothetical protein